MSLIFQVEIESLEHSGLGLQVFLIYTFLVFTCLFFPFIKRVFQSRLESAQIDRPPQAVPNQPQHQPHPQEQQHQNEMPRPHARSDNEERDCPICLSAPSFKVETNCGHMYCSDCLLSYINLDSQSRISLMSSASPTRCPYCRRDINLIVSGSASQPWTDEEKQSQDGRKFITEINQYNQKFSNRPRSVFSNLSDAPIFLRRFIAELFSGGPGTIRLLFQIRLAIFFISTLLYVLSPLDILPEAIFGIFGLLDDIFIMSAFAIYFAAQVRTMLVQREMNAAAIAQELIQQFQLHQQMRR